MTGTMDILDRRFRGLVAKINRGECVLVLGPRVTVPGRTPVGSEVPLDDHISSGLLDELSAGRAGEDSGPAPDRDLRAAVARYEREVSAAGCRSTIAQLYAEFDERTTDLHRDLASLPFRLVITATADRMMINALREQGKERAQEACYNFSKGVAQQGVLATPGPENPVVYSLFGRHDQPESMVINDKNLLDYLVRLVRESPPLPDAVRATLRAPSNVFLFMGFGFTNWWLRLLLKVLEVTGVENRALSLALEDDVSFESPMSIESRRFFEAAGIFIQARRDWSALAKYLVKEFHESGAPRRDSPGPTSDVRAIRGAPLVFVSYASEDAGLADALRERLEQRGVRVWSDRQNLRAGQNWRHQIEHVIGSVNYFIFLQTENMDQRDAEPRDGVYNWELKEALARLNNRPHGSVFVVHVTVGACRVRPEPELRDLHRVPCDAEGQIDALADSLIAEHAAASSEPAGLEVRKVG